MLMRLMLFARDRSSLLAADWQQEALALLMDGEI